MAFGRDDELGIYDDKAQLDHDVAMSLATILSDLDAEGVGRDAALASLRRAIKATS